ncbi:hypothetical protein [Tumebacillus flagellatus]|uniref:Uncharacterized protein n=1 Tax=Tumebacillus flagellatus TaxID=1157490 RepID=A0A074LYZ4_9BACL|nr:hypothetical protein [Tumebacillus flagellatus]KEO85288.1 hypothetical protein EL26_01645 [Tumebacillus flagellatus]
MNAQNFVNRFTLLTFSAALVLAGTGAATPKSASAASDEVCYSQWEGESTYVTRCSGTNYDVVGKTLVQADYTPVMNQNFLISVAKGQTQTLSSSKTVEHKIETSLNVSLNTKLFGKISLATLGTSTGTTTTLYNTTTVYTGPELSSPYNSRKYYAGEIFDLYNVTIHEYNYTTEYIDFYDSNGALLHSGMQTYTSTDHGTYNEQVKVPRPVEYTVDAYY